MQLSRSLTSACSALIAFMVLAVSCTAQVATRSDDAAKEKPNSELKGLFEADQQARKSGGNIDWSSVSKADAERRKRTRQLIDSGQLRTGEDFERAAFIFQHGDSTDDYLLAHTLAMIAVSKGQRKALWIASATLDRYLQHEDKPQIFGTQYLLMPDKPATQEPYNRELVPDALRKELGVKTQAEQAEQVRELDSRKPHTAQ